MNEGKKERIYFRSETPMPLPDYYDRDIVKCSQKLERSLCFLGVSSSSF